MPLDPQMQELVALTAEFRAVPTHQKTAQQARADTLERTAAMAGMGDGPEPIARVEDRAIPGPGGEIPIRIYTPGEPSGGCILYFHGGGWVICNLDTHDAPARALANLSGAMVISVDYRLAPEAKYPAAAEDCYAATQWVSEHGAELGIDPSRIAVAGDSAGGNLAAVVAQMARERGGPPIAFQLLIYPVTDLDFTTGSYVEHGSSEDLLSIEDMSWFWNHYLESPGQAKEPYAAPLRADDLGGLPPALVITAEYDVLRDEGEAYARRLWSAGVATQLSRYDGVVHGFFNMAPILDKATAAQQEAGAAIRAAFGA